MKARAAIAGMILVGSGVLGGAAGARAAETIEVKIPAPLGSAEAAGLKVGDVVSVGETSATAGQSGAGSSAVPVSVLGKPLVGATQTTNGTSSGALLDTKDTPLGRVQVAPYSATVNQTATQRQSSAQSAAARVDVVDPDIIHIDVLQSASSATHTGPLSRGQAVSDGVVVRIGGPDGTIIRILHSEADATGHGRTYLLAIGDNAIIDNRVMSAACALDLGPLLNVACLRVAGGVEGLTASVLEAVVGGTDGLTAGLITASSSGGGAPAAGNAPQVLGQSLEQARSGGLARTGYSVWFSALFAMALASLGMAMVATAKAWAPALLRTR